MKFWRHLKAAWNYGRVFPYFDAADAEDFWSKQDAESLRAFFNTDTGRKIKARLNNWQIKMALAAVRNPQCSPYMNGQASGVDATIAAIDAHFPQPQEIEQEEPEPFTALETA